MERGDAVQSHHVARRVVQHECHAVEAGDPMEHLDEIAKQGRKVPV